MPAVEQLRAPAVALVAPVVPLRDLITGLAAAELPGRTAQLLALLPENARNTAATA